MDTKNSASKTPDSIIEDHIWFSTVPGMLPVPVLDVVAISAVQVDMIRQLCRHYGQPFDEQRGKAIVLSLTTSAFGRISAYSARSVFKAIPVVGWAIGGAAMSLFAASSTYAVGQVFKEHLNAGGTLYDLNPENFQKFYYDQVDKARRALSDWWQNPWA